MYTIQSENCEHNYILKPSILMNKTDYPRNWKNKKTIIIPFGTCKIGGQVFINCKLKNIIIPNTITSIGCSAFQWCSKLSEIDIPDNVRRIGNGAFIGCHKLNHIYFHENSKLEHIGDKCFQNCYNLQNIELPKSLKTIGIDAFKNCPLKKITMTENIYNKYFKNNFKIFKDTEIYIYKSIDIDTLKQQVKKLWVDLYNEGTSLPKPDIENLPQNVLEELVNDYQHILKCVVSVKDYTEYYNREFLTIEDF